MIYIIMGVSGSGNSVGHFMKEMTSTLRRTLRRCLVVNHSQTSERSSGSDALVVCSALKRLYRQILLHGSKALCSFVDPDHPILPPTIPDVFFLFMHGDYNLIHHRMVARRGHYMKENLLRSQFEALEPPSDDENVLLLDIRMSITAMAAEVEKHLISLNTAGVHQTDCDKQQ
ncbi:probable gluconokinase isoform X2 [Sphaeramia orbicularis]|uniref:probable gluconokinase isoform X2 n=1 Tax=Sphaeramia orbicularis TaxID=375764 RepID=UPI00117CEC01|nr:probable gluconokinase isoform X2 [Sphaeramia orbicularis]